VSMGQINNRLLFTLLVVPVVVSGIRLDFQSDAT